MKEIRSAISWWSMFSSRPSGMRELVVARISRMFSCNRVFRRSSPSTGVTPVPASSLSTRPVPSEEVTVPFSGSIRSPLEGTKLCREHEILAGAHAGFPRRRGHPGSAPNQPTAGEFPIRSGPVRDGPRRQPRQGLEPGSGPVRTGRPGVPGESREASDPFQEKGAGILNRRFREFRRG